MVTHFPQGHSQVMKKPPPSPPIDMLTAYGIAYVFGCIHTQRAVNFRLFFPTPLVMTPVYSKLFLDPCFREEVVLLIFLLYKQTQKAPVMEVKGALL